MNVARQAVAVWCLVAFNVSGAPAADNEKMVRDADAAFWMAYNACDMMVISGLLTADIEFYHDKTGLTASRSAVVDSLRNGPCADPDSRLRREVVDGSLMFHPLKDGYAVLAGRHQFYVQQPEHAERLDGQAEFTTLWKLDGGQWRMHRVLSYAHGPVPYTPPPVTLRLPAVALASHAGRYRSARIGTIDVIVDGDHLKLTAGSFIATLYPASATRFFAEERDIQFEFEAGERGVSQSLAVYENGSVTERALREK